jgi:hypothetical protein
MESEKDIPYVDKVNSYQRKTGLTEPFQTGKIVKEIPSEMFRIPRQLLCFWRDSYARRKFQLNADG